MKATLDVEQQRLVLDPAWNEIDLLKLLPGYRYQAKTKLHTLPLTWAALVQLRGLLGAAFEYGDDVAGWAWQERQQRIDPALEWRGVIAADWPGSDLYPFQNAGVAWMQAAGSGLLGDEMGCGKTPQALKWLLVTNRLPALVVCPNSVKWHWEARVPRWLPDGTPYVIDGGTVTARKILAAAAEDPSAVVIINYEAVRAHSRLAPYGSTKLKRCRECDPRFGDENLKPHQCHVHPKELNNFGFRAAIIDEVHMCGEPTSQQTRAVWAVVHDPSVEARWGLTGTPDNIKRLWSIMHTVAPLEYPTKTQFMDRYALTAYNAYGGTDVVGLRPDTREELFRFLDPRFRRMIKDVVLDQLPPVVREIRYAALTPAMRKAYDQLDKQLFTQLPNGQTLITQNKLVARARLMQFAAGTVTVEKPDEDDIASWLVRIGLPSPKLDVLDEVLDELGDQSFVIACEHVDLARLAAERLGDRGVRHQLVAGNVHPSTVAQATQDLSSGAVQALVFTHKKGGTGLDMSGAGVMIMLQRTDSLIGEIQTEGRVHRIGSEKHDVVRIIDIVTRDTKEEAQIVRLHQKLEQLQEIARDRAQLQQHLAATLPGDAVFADLVGKLDQLNVRREQLLTGEHEGWLLEEPEEV